MSLESHKGIEGEEQNEGSFDLKKRAYFSRLALSVLEAMRMHKNPGSLWERNKEGKRDWENVSEHCLVEVARARVLGEKLRLPETTMREVALGAALHDFNKRHEIEAIKAAIARGESGGEASDKTDEEGEYELHKFGFGENVVEIAGSVGGKSKELFGMTRILAQEKLTDKDVALLLMHYVDGYTRGSDWAEPVAKEEDGMVVNEVDRRTRKNLENPNYRKKNEESIVEFTDNPILHGRGGIENEGVVCHLIEKRLAALITERTEETIDPLGLPEVVDQEIRKKIAASAL